MSFARWLESIVNMEVFWYGPKWMNAKPGPDGRVPQYEPPKDPYWMQGPQRDEQARLDGLSRKFWEEDRKNK